MSGAFDDWMKTVQAGSEHDLSGFLPAATATPTKLHAAMRYALLGGGKRVRPLLVYAAGALFDADATVLALGIVGGVSMQLAASACAPCWPMPAAHCSTPTPTRWPAPRPPWK